jgi:hypothetical protein
MGMQASFTFYLRANYDNHHVGKGWAMFVGRVAELVFLGRVLGNK